MVDDETEGPSCECSCSFDTRALVQTLDEVVVERNVYTKKSHRFRPYSILPSKYTLVEEKKTDLYYEELCSINVNIRPVNLRSGGLLRSLLSSSSYTPCCSLAQEHCSVEARRRNPSVEGDALIDELSDYFTHYVIVQSKMSALAESMYV